MAIKKPFFVISLPNHLQKYFLEISLFFDTPTVTSKYVTSTSTFTIVRMRNETLFQFKKKKRKTMLTSLRILKFWQQQKCVQVSSSRFPILPWCFLWPAGRSKISRFRVNNIYSIPLRASRAFAAFQTQEPKNYLSNRDEQSCAAQLPWNFFFFPLARVMIVSRLYGAARTSTIALKLRRIGRRWRQNRPFASRRSEGMPGKGWKDETRAAFVAEFSNSA